ncbi:M16 family metallopeptidase [Rubrolithibacter danxiaensis]|uniref:M16 family metallopeptidase n=1 Tax=Rubrolithibacter danxiaensis TaxID=3390805 RepID=UPI003BF91439
MKTPKLILCAFAVLLFNLSVQAQKQSDKPRTKQTVTSASQLLPLDSNVIVGKLANGFTYYIRKNTEPKDRAQLYLAVKAGSILENDNQKGLAHFTEHMSFNGTKNYPKNELVNYLQKAGVRFGADLNAYTSFDQTVYMLPIPTDDQDVFKNGMQIMRDWAQEATFDTVEINKERGVVLEEKRLGKGAQERMQNKYLPLIFNNSRYSERLPIGTEEVLKNFKPETIKSFYKDWYRPNLEALIVVGDIDVKKVEQMIKNEFSDLKNPANPRARVDYKIPLINKNQFIAVTDKEFPVTVAQVLIKHPERKIKTTADLRYSMVRSLYNQMLSSRFSELIKQANPPFVQGGSSIGGFLAGLDVASAFVVAKPGELEKGFKAVLTETERVKRFGFTSTELARAKESFMTSVETAYKERDKTASDAFVQEYLQHFLEEEASPGITYEFNFYKNNIEGISVADVNALAKEYLTDVNRDVLIMGPEKDAATLPDEATVNSWIKAVQQQKLAAYVDDVSDKPLIESKPAAGKIVSGKKINELGVTELELSNGVKVVLKPTDFKNDEISFSAFSPGGTSLYSDADYQSASNASSLIGRSGVGSFSPVQLPKMLAGKRVFVSPYISERSEGIYASATPKDLETALQLTYLYFTQPRKDEAIYSAFITQQKAMLENRSSDPNAVFSDTVSAVLGNYNVRRTGPSLAKINQIDLDKAFKIYKERFADASDFTFTFVGSFNVADIKPLIEQYLGALPSIKRKEEAKDLGIYAPKGKVEKKVYKGQEQKASVRLVFTGDYTYNTENNNRIDALGEILQIKLIERLREDESGVYSPGVRASYSKYPKNRYSFTVSFGCGPENVEKLIASTLDEINKLKKNGPEAQDIAKFIAEEQRSTQVQLKENSFWASYLANQYENKEDPKEVLTYLDSLKKITPASLKEAANKYLSGENLIKLVLLPEGKK